MNFWPINSFIHFLSFTHNLGLCEQVAFIKDGAIQACGRIQDLKRDLRLGDTILISFQGNLQESSLGRMAGIYGFQANDSACRIFVDDHRKRHPQILDFFIGQKVFIHDLRIQESDLEDVFMALTR